MHSLPGFVYALTMRKTQSRTDTVGNLSRKARHLSLLSMIFAGVAILLALFSIMFSPSAANADETIPVGNGLYINGYDGIITLSDDYGNEMLLKANCAKVVVDFGYSNLADFVKSDDTSNPLYIETCMDRASS